MGKPDQLQRFRQQGGDGVAPLLAQWFAHSARHDMLGMEFPAADPVDDLLSDLAQTNALPDDLRPVPGQSDDVAFSRVGIQTEHDIRAGKMEEAEGMTEDQLGQREQAAQPAGGRWRFQSEDAVSGLGGSQGMTDRADAADAGGNGRHLPEGSADAEGLETAELLHLQAGFRHLAGIVQADADAGVTFDAGYR